MMLGESSDCPTSESIPFPYPATPPSYHDIPERLRRADASSFVIGTRGLECGLPSWARLCRHHSVDKAPAYNIHFPSTTVTTQTAPNSMSSHAPPTPHDPTPAEAKVLFDLISTKFPTATLGPEKWYILVLSALVSGGQPQLAAPLYTHLIAQPEYQTPEQRQRLMRRLRETLFKLIVIVGVCRPLEAVLEIESVLERDEDRDWSFSRWVL
jgi:hypothetical protein